MSEQTHPVLNNKPLMEAIFELRWELPEQQSEGIEDPYQILVGRLYDGLKGEYPSHQRLETANIPIEMAQFVVQHRFRATKGGWPLVQMGPGIITLNDTEGYIWKDFKKRIMELVGVFFSAVSDLEKPLISQLLLRYVDAIDFDFEAEDTFLFLKEKMQVTIELISGLFENTSVASQPVGLDLRFSFPAENPQGAMNMRFARGEVDGQSSLIWETMVQSLGDDVPQTEEGIGSWSEAAHSITSDWFFKTIEGELLRRFE